MTNYLSDKRFVNRIRFTHYLILALLCFFFIVKNTEGAELFSVQSLSIDGTILSAISSDLNDNGSVEIIVLSKTGIYPKEKRWISIYRTEKSEQYLNPAWQRWELDHAATMLEVGDIASSPGKEIFYLTTSGISYYPQGKDGTYSKKSHKLLEFPTITVSPVVSYLPRSELLKDWKGNNRKMLLAPQFNTLAFFDKDSSGEWRKTDTISITPRTFLFSDNEDDGGAFRDYSVHAEFRLPRIFTMDFNGDYLQDLILTEQESLTVHLQKADGKFSEEPSFKIVFPVRPSGKEADVNLFYLTTPVYLNEDKYVDVILTLTKGTGKFLEQDIIIYIFLNKQNLESPFAKEPDQTITANGVTPGVNIADVDSDGDADLYFTKIKLGFWKIVQNLISKRVTLDTSIYLLQNDNRYPDDSDFLLKTEYKINLTHKIRFQGTWPTIKSDFNKDGLIDLLVARDGKIEIFLNTLSENLFSKPFVQSGVFTSPFMQITDLNNDGFNDLIFYEKKRNGEISVLLNKGIWNNTTSSNRDNKTKN
jgi:hypothetical protein